MYKILTCLAPTNSITRFYIIFKFVKSTVKLLLASGKVTKHYLLFILKCY